MCLQIKNEFCKHTANKPGGVYEANLDHIIMNMCLCLSLTHISRVTLRTSSTGLQYHTDIESFVAEDKTVSISGEDSRA